MIASRKSQTHVGRVAASSRPFPPLRLLQPSGVVALTCLFAASSCTSGTEPKSKPTPSLTASTVTSSRPTLVADGADTAVIRVQLINEHGSPITESGGTISLATTSGTLSSVLDRHDGTYTATLTAPTVVGTATVTANLNGHPLTQQATIHLIPGPLARFVLEASGGGAIPVQEAGIPFVIRISAQDANGNLDTAFSDTAHISSTGSLSRGGGASSRFTDGVLAGDTVTLSDDGSFTISASSGAELGTSDTIRVTPGELVLRNGAISVMASDGSGLTPLTSPANPADQWPKWSPNRAKIAFSRQVMGDSQQIFIMNADGSGLVDVSDHLALTDHWPSWAPNSDQLVFASSRAGALAIFTMNSDGTNISQVTDTVCACDLPSWSPDGTRLVYSGNRDGNYSLYTSNVDGSNERRVTSGARLDNEARYSPDGTRLVFCRLDSGLQSIWVVNVDGSGLKMLSNVGAPQYPTWSPDGSRIVFSASPAGNRELFMMNADGTNVHPLTAGNSFFDQPDWRH